MHIFLKALSKPPLETCICIFIGISSFAAKLASAPRKSSEHRSIRFGPNTRAEHLGGRSGGDRIACALTYTYPPNRLPNFAELGTAQRPEVSDQFGKIENTRSQTSV